METREALIATADGRLFAKCWSPSSARQAAGLAPIVMFHESLGAVSLWRDLPGKLAAATGRTVVAYDRLGFGRSDPHPGRLATRFIAGEAFGDFSAVRAHFGIDAFVAYGHSTGGSIAAACAVAFPQQCAALITESAHAFVEACTLDGIRKAGREFVQPARFARLRRHHADKVYWVLDAWINTWLSAEFASWSLDDELPRIRCPVLVVHGDSDPFGSLAHPRYITGRVRSEVSVLVLPGIGHTPHRECESRFLDAVSGFLARTK